MKGGAKKIGIRIEMRDVIIYQKKEERNRKI